MHDYEQLAAQAPANIGFFRYLVAVVIALMS